MSTALALSPHLDDAVFSCGGTLSLLTRAGWRVVVATLFTRSVPNQQGFALTCQLDKGLGPEVDYMSLRRAEDTAAMRALGVETPIHVPLPEAPHRGYHSAAELFGVEKSDDLVADDIRRAVATLLDQQRPDLVFAPQAIGGHVDHGQVVRALSNVDRPIVWWRDFPYAARSACPAEPFRDQMSRIPEWRVVLDDAAIASRETSCLAYASQLGFQFGGPDGLRAKLAQGGATEHFRAAQPMPIELRLDLRSMRPAVLSP